MKYGRHGSMLPCLLSSRDSATPERNSPKDRFRQISFTAGDAMSVIKMTDLDLAGKRVLMREDINVPLKNGQVGDDTRIRASMPTIQRAVKAGAKVMEMSHLGRPDEGDYSEEYSVMPVAVQLAKLLGQPVRVAKDYLDGVKVAAGDVVMFENVRFFM